MKVEFNAGFRTVNVGGDGIITIPSDSGEVVPIQTAPPQGSAHLNPGFDDVSGGVPVNWDFSWYVGTPTAAAESTLVYSGTGALRLSLAAGSVGDHQYAISNTFDVPPSGSVNFTALGIATTGDPTVKLGLLTRTTGTPLFLDEPSSVGNERADAEAVPSDWTMFQRRIAVPAGHTRARVYVKVESPTGSAVSVVVDNTGSVVFPGVLFETAWAAVPLATNWNGTIGSFGTPEYRRVGDHVEFSGIAARTGSTSTGGAAVTSAPLDEMFRPVEARIISSTGGALFLNTDGHIYQTAAMTAGTPLYFDGGDVRLS